MPSAPRLEDSEGPGKSKATHFKMLTLGQSISISLETNGKGYIGYIAELPGTFLRGKTEDEALSKVEGEVKSYLKWLGIEAQKPPVPLVVQRHHCSLMVEDADSEILLNHDKEPMNEAEFKRFRDVVWLAGETFLKIYTHAPFKDWIDKGRNRSTFYGDTPKTIQEIFDHVRHCQYYYLSRAKVEFEKKEEDFMNIRGFCLKEIEGVYRKNNNAVTFETDHEFWTLKKILRRFIVHDRIHGKAMIRILEKQRQHGLIHEYENPFFFGMEV